MLAGFALRSPRGAIVPQALGLFQRVVRDSQQAQAGACCAESARSVRGVELGACAAVQLALVVVIKKPHQDHLMGFWV